MKTLIIVFLSLLLLTGTDVRPVFSQMFRALSYVAEFPDNPPLHKPARVIQPEAAPSEPMDLPFLESPTASTIEDLTLDQALEQAETIQIGIDARR